MTTTVEEFPKDKITREEVEKVREERLTRPLVISCEITEDATNWILTTVLRAVGVQAKSPKKPRKAKSGKIKGKRPIGT